MGDRQKILSEPGKGRVDLEAFWYLLVTALNQTEHFGPVSRRHNHHTSANEAPRCAEAPRHGGARPGAEGHSRGLRGNLKGRESDVKGLGKLG